MALARLPNIQPLFTYLAVETRIVKRLSTGTFHEIYHIVGEGKTIERIKTVQPNATYISLTEFYTLPELPNDAYEFSTDGGKLPLLFWLLTRQEARDNWLLTGWRRNAWDERDVMITPYIEFDDGAQLKEFLRLDNHPVYTPQIVAHNWLIANDLHNLG